ncbi:Aldo/keto reductase [Irpex lacteus]|nr:Aldo/keto reductase [Irpex lacteus]
MPFGSVTLNDGNKIPTIAFGTGSKWKGTDVTQYVEQALKLGFVHLDTAQFYRTEPFVRKAIESSGVQREDLYITTKYGGGSPRQAIRESLSNLGVKSVDLYLIHTPRVDIPSTWSEFEKFKNEGLAKSIGVSNFNLELLQKLVKEANIKPAVNQINFSPYNYAENKELLAYAAKHGIIIEAYSSLAPITRYPGGPVDKPVNAAAKRLGATPTQVILSWVRSKGVVIVTTSSTESHLKEYLDVGDLPPLTEEEVAAIDAAGAQGEPVEFDLERGNTQTSLRASRLQLPPWIWNVVRTLVGSLALLVVLATFAYFS